MAVLFFCASLIKTHLVSLFEKGNLPSLFSNLKNDLELPAIFLLPEIAECKDALLHLGADAAMMTGSGSAVFGLFTEEDKARLAAEKMKEISFESHFCALL